jgi:hypothetical protein
MQGTPPRKWGVVRVVSKPGTRAHPVRPRDDQCLLQSPHTLHDPGIESLPLALQLPHMLQPDPTDQPAPRAADQDRLRSPLGEGIVVHPRPNTRDPLDIFCEAACGDVDRVIV